MATLEKQTPHPYEQTFADIPRGIAHDIGHSSTIGEIGVGHVSPALPEGYEYADAATIDPLEVAGLLRQVEIGSDTDDDYMQQRAEDLGHFGEDVVDVGVRDSTGGALIGFGSIAYDGVLGRLGDFVVSPDHQGKGIGKSIIRERLAIADSRGITMLSVHSMEPTNTLHSFYIEQGFVPDSTGNLMRIAQRAPETT